MAVRRRILLIASSVLLILLIALSLATAIEVRAPQQKVIQVIFAQAQKVNAGDRFAGQKAKLNGTDFDRGDVLNGTALASLHSAETPRPSATVATGDGIHKATSSSRPDASWSAEGVIGPVKTATPTPTPVRTPRPPQPPQIPVVALSYSGSGGPKHCRGNLVQQQVFAPPLQQWKNGTCVNLPSEARCGVFFSSKGDNCEAQLFNMPDCHNTTKTYLNTVVFMPEERAVGALWSSMFVRCGVEVPEAKMLDPSILGGALKKKPKPGGG
jgi:hypothetical protein